MATLLTGEGEGAARPARGGAVRVRLWWAGVLCAVLALGGMPGTAGAATRYTKDTAPAAQGDAAAQPAAPGGTPINAGGKLDPDIAKATKGPVSLGATTIGSPANFDECVRVALAQSPLLTKSAVEIESKRLDVGDAYSGYIPTFVLSTTFYLNLPKYKYTGYSTAMSTYESNITNNAQTNAQNLSSLMSSARAADPNRDRPKYDLNFSTGTWNPILTAFEVSARKELVNVAVLSHLKVIDQGIKRLAATFLKLGMVDAQAKLAKEKEDLAAKNLEYAKTRAGLGQGALLEVRIAEGKVSLAKAESEKMRTSRAVLLDDLKFVMGVPFIQKVDLDIANYQEQVLGGFNPADVSDEKLRRHSFSLRIAQYERSLQNKSIYLAYVHFLPTFSVGFTSVSTLNSSSYDSSNSKIPFMYPNLQLNLPLDWWTKARDVSRQYKKLAQKDVEIHKTEFEVMSEYQQALAKLRAADSDFKLSEAKADVLKLKVQQAQLLFESGQAEYDAIVTAMESFLEGKGNVLQRLQDRNEAMLDLRSMSGDFQERYINATVMENI
jgi:outer membrane protein TolC